MYRITFEKDDVVLFSEEGNKGYIDLDFIYVGYRVGLLLEEYMGDYECKFADVEDMPETEEDILVMTEEDGLTTLKNLLKDIMEYDIGGLWDYNQANVYLNGSDKHMVVSFDIEHNDSYYTMKTVCYDNYKKEEEEV